MRIRLDGTHAEITYSMFRIREIFTVTSVTHPVPDHARTGKYRVFVDIIPRQIRNSR
ncbi:hypothetical protein Misp01_52100 [Microtetraspora sp. NBRC 13810]|uniref:hypothetical protein n=1 Tax=Microtetraspora sp. NBRC 13810 TaxID=3030990 RepID=UPI0025571A06|nr:hypothetical protein [Microtetraspora sp. NBRC 13810]GLW10081.1 hypothetical protein Misp01_52100 [Microtetraspora sp. NBRC 13810]